MMELCKSESDDETAEAEEKSDAIQQETEQLEQVSDITNNDSEMNTEKTNDAVECVENESVTDVDAANNDLVFTQLIESESVNTSVTEKDISNIEVVNNEEPVTPSNATKEQQEDTEKDYSNTDFKLVYNDSVEEEQLATENTKNENTIPNNTDDLESNSEQVIKVNSEPESQLITLHYTENNTEEIEKPDRLEELDEPEKPEDSSNEITEIVDIAAEEDKQDDFFSDDDVNMEDIDRIIENAEIMKGII